MMRILYKIINIIYNVVLKISLAVDKVMEFTYMSMECSKIQFKTLDVFKAIFFTQGI